MNRKSILLAGLLCVVSAMSVEIAWGQEPLEIIGTLRFSSPVASPAQALQYGVGAHYTDTTDRDDEDFIPPFPALPGTFVVYLDRACDSKDGDPPCWWQADFRSIPDSAKGESSQFWIEYRIGISNNTERTLSLSIFPLDWPSGVDSIYVEDVILPRAFQHTLTGPVEVEIEDIQTTQLRLRVYYNLNTLSVDQELVESVSPILLEVLPNPSVYDQVILRSAFRQGDRILVTDMLGRVVNEIDVPEAAEEIRIGTAGMAAGNYPVAKLNEKGEIVGRDLLRVIR